MTHGDENGTKITVWDVLDVVLLCLAGVCFFFAILYWVMGQVQRAELCAGGFVCFLVPTLVLLCVER